MSCPDHEQIHALHDGELSPDQRVIVAEHCRVCADCAALLSELGALSRMVEAAPRAQMSAAALRRLEQAWWRKRDRGVLRLAEWLTAAAAAIIIATLLYSPQPRETFNQSSAMAWQTDALTPPGETRDDPAADIVAVAEWMANDLSQAAR